MGRACWVAGLTMPTFQEVLSAARTLNATERIRLANSLREDVPPAEWPLPDAEWVAEAQRRSAEYDEGHFTIVEVSSTER